MTSEETAAIQKSIQAKLDHNCRDSRTHIPFTYEECCMLSWYIRTHADLLSLANGLCKRLGIALTYVVSMWDCYRGGEFSPVVKFRPEDALHVITFEYSKSQELCSSSQETIKMIAGRELGDDE
jgi:hypothetical protein